MKKQLYKLNSRLTLKVMVLGFLAFSLGACDDEAAESEVADTTASSIQATAAENTTQQQEPAENMAADIQEKPSTDAGFLNYDMVLGDPDAPVEIIEYASITCNHCATFHTQVLPQIKENYVDTGKAKIVMRSFLLNGIDAQGSAISRCVPEKRYFMFMDAVFGRQTQWYNIPEYQRLSSLHDQQTANRMFISQTMEELSKIARQVGLNQAKIDACVADEKIGEYLFSIYQEAIDKYKVDATPTIIVNGNKAGNDYRSIERAIEAALN